MVVFQSKLIAVKNLATAVVVVALMCTLGTRLLKTAPHTATRYCVRCVKDRGNPVICGAFLRLAEDTPEVQVNRSNQSKIWDGYFQESVRNKELHQNMST
jgi:hypothetical protein